MNINRALLDTGCRQERLQRAQKEFTEAMMEAGYKPFGPFWIKEPSFHTEYSKGSEEDNGFAGIVIVLVLLFASSGGCYLWSVARTPVLEYKSVAVHFVSDSYTRIYESSYLLDSVATYILGLLKDDPNVTIVLKGHSDSRGDEEYNTWLSERRAHTIARYLIKRGIPRNKIVVEAYGENFPVASNLTPEGRRLNRRVEIVIRKPNRPTFEGYLKFLGLKDP